MSSGRDLGLPKDIQGVIVLTEVLVLPLIGMGEFLRVEEIELVFDLEYCAMMPRSKR
jgi:hypothetical protein